MSPTPRAYRFKDASQTASIKRLARLLNGKPHVHAETYGICFTGGGHEVSGVTWLDWERSESVSIDSKTHPRTRIREVLVTFRRARENRKEARK